MSPATKFIRPEPGRKVRHPASGPQRGEVLADAGETVVWNGYWERKLQAGDVALALEPKAPPANPGKDA